MMAMNRNEPAVTEQISTIPENLQPIGVEMNADFIARKRLCAA
jgi:hypothetical protein